MKTPNGWKKALLHHVAHVQTGLSKSEGRLGPSIKRPYLRVANVQDGYLDLTELKEIDVPAKQLERFRLHTNDVLLTEGGDVDKLGRGCIWQGEIPNCVHQNHLFAVRVTNQELLSPHFLACQIRSENAKRYFLSCAKQTTNLASINSSQIKELPLFLPPLIEQHEIVHLACVWDSAIAKTERLIFLRKKQKAWLLSRVVAESSKFTKLGDFLHSSSRSVPKPQEPYWALGIRSHGKGTFQRFVENPNGVAMEQLYALNRDDVIVNITFAWEGAIATVKQEDINCLVSHRFPTYRVDRERADSEYVKHIINRKEFFSQLALISPGGAGRNRVLNKKDFLKLTVPMPPLAEQQRLARILTALDVLVANQQSLLASLESQKRGLMQKLLTGQWRVKLPETEQA